MDQLGQAVPQGSWHKSRGAPDKFFYHAELTLALLTHESNKLFAMYKGLYSDSSLEHFKSQYISPNLGP